MEHLEAFGERRERLLAALRPARAEAFLTTAPPNVRYLSGFTGSNGAVLVSAERAMLFTDPRYRTQAFEEVAQNGHGQTRPPNLANSMVNGRRGIRAPRALESDCDVKIGKGTLVKEIAAQVKRLRLKSLAFESNRIGYAEHAQLKEALPGVRLKPLAGAVETIRMVKSEDEIGAIRASVQLNSVALGQALEQFRPAMTEAGLAAEIEYRMRCLGADGTSFDTIIASGARSALPHAHPTDHPINPDQLLLIDMGANVAGYASDMTRTYAVGKLDAKIRRMYRAVLESQLAAIDAVKPGASCASVDRAARAVLRGYGMDQFFIHSTGHGLGLEIHERPRLGRKEMTKLEAGMAITIEPGVYQEGLGGVRIEDTVIVTATGCEVLTPTGKELVVL